MHRSWQIRQPAPQSKLRELHPKGSLSLLCAGVAENANQPRFSVEPNIAIAADANVSETENTGNISVSWSSLWPFDTFLCSETEKTAIISVSRNSSMFSSNEYSVRQAPSPEYTIPDDYRSSAAGGSTLGPSSH